MGFFKRLFGLEDNNRSIEDYVTRGEYNELYRFYKEVYAKNEKLQKQMLDHYEELKALYNQISAPTIPSFDFNKLYGFGKNTTGGQGGTIYTVSNLNNNGPGSLREAVEASGTREIRFSVSGTINLTSGLTISNGNISILGETAPNGGICIAGAEITIAASEVLISNIRIRRGEDSGARLTSGTLEVGKDYRIWDLQPGDDFSNVGYISEGTIFTATNTTPTTWTNSTEVLNIDDFADDDTIFFNGTGSQISNIVFKNCSISWSIDENVGFFSVGGGGVANVSFQYCIISEGLAESHHDNGSHSMAVLMNDQVIGITFYKNYFSHNFDRHIRANGGNQWEFINNVVYNYQYTSIMGYGCEFDMINNNYKEGNSGSPQSSSFADLTSSGQNGFVIGDTRAYVVGNESDSSLAQTDSALAPYNEGSRIHNATLDTEIDSVADAITDVLQYAGAVLPKRDSVDTRVIDDYTNDTGNIINTQEQVGGYPDLTI